MLKVWTIGHISRARLGSSARTTLRPRSVATTPGGSNFTAPRMQERLRPLTEVPTRIRQVRHNNRSLLFWVSKLVLGSTALPKPSLSQRSHAWPLPRAFSRSNPINLGSDSAVYRRSEERRGLEERTGL